MREHHLVAAARVEAPAVQKHHGGQPGRCLNQMIILIIIMPESNDNIGDNYAIKNYENLLDCLLF